MSILQELRDAVAEATTNVVAAQLDAGIDVGNDGEQATGELRHLRAAPHDRVRRNEPSGHSCATCSTTLTT